MQKQNIILAVKGPEVPEQLMNDLISLVQAKGYEIEFAGVHREHGKMDCAIGTVEQLDGVPVPTVAAPGQTADPKLLEILTLHTRQLTMLTQGQDLLLKRTEPQTEAPKTRRKSAAEKKEGGAAGTEAGGQQPQSPAENLSLEGQTQEGGEGEKDSQESAPDEKQAEESAVDESQESETGDPQQQEESAA